MTSTGLFLIFNVISGRLFLGDAGAYGLGAALALSGLYLYSEGTFSAAFLATLLMYPCIELLVSMFRRLVLGRSMFLPDNDHLHNRIYFHLQNRMKSKTMAKLKHKNNQIFLTDDTGALLLWCLKSNSLKRNYGQPPPNMLYLIIEIPMNLINRNNYINRL